MSSHHPAGDATTRFSNRVADYVRFRPGYPDGVVDILRRRARLGPGTRVADIGAGTGIFTRLLLAAGATVDAVEPNRAMRAALAAALPGEPRLHLVDGTAEVTSLPARSVALVTAAQAFHWFDRASAGAEFRRILEAGGKVALVWNRRLDSGDPFSVGYEALLVRWCPDYRAVDHRQVDEDVIAAFFHPGRVERVAFPNAQDFDFDGLRGRLLSSSYAPAAGHPNHEPMLADLRRLFDAQARDGRVRFAYETEVHLGRFEG